MWLDSACPTISSIAAPTIRHPNLRPSNASLLHSAGGRMFAPENKFEVVFDSPATVDALEYVKSLQPYMPKGAVSYSFLEVVDSIVTGRVKSPTSSW